MISSGSRARITSEFEKFFHPFKYPVRAPIALATLTLAIVFFTVILPGLIAQSQHVFYGSDMVAKLDKMIGVLKNKPNKTDGEADLIERVENWQTLKKRIASVDQALIELDPKQVSKAQLSTLTELRKIYLAEQNRRLRVLPYYLNPLMPLWPTLYTCLLWLLLLLPPIRDERRSVSWPKTFIISVPLLGVYIWPFILRATMLAEERRTVFAYPNIDLSSASFVYQFLLICGVTIMTARLTVLWTLEIIAVGSDKRYKQTADGSEILRGEYADHLSMELSLWQLRSFILGLGFIFYTRFFWLMISEYGDHRYIFDAICVHSFWALLWFVMTLPLCRQWHDWNRRRRRLIHKLMEKTPAENSAMIDVLKEQQPASATNLVGSAVLAFSAFAFPLLHAFFSK